MIKKVIVADDDLDAHELVQDMLQISLEGVNIDQAMSGESFLKKIGEAVTPYDLILFNVRMRHANGADLLAIVKDRFPGQTDRIVLMADAPLSVEHSPATEPICIIKPFSLDCFGEIVKKVCCG
jgi:DNA-binding NtrC family response regulator